MGIAVYYQTVEPVPDAVRSVLLREVEELAEPHAYWGEPITFYNMFPCFAEEDGRLRASSKVFLPGFSTADGKLVRVDEADDLFMACRDMHFIVDRLGDWSGRFGLTWRVSSDHDLVAGTIAGGNGDEALRTSLGLFAQQARYDPADPAGEEHARTILERYAADDE